MLVLARDDRSNHTSARPYTAPTTAPAQASVTARIRTISGPKPPLVAGSGLAKMTIIRSAQARELAGIYSAAHEVSQREPLCEAQDRTEYQPHQEYEPDDRRVGRLGRSRASSGVRAQGQDGAHLGELPSAPVLP
jgi:hypothetical protein